MLVECPHCHVPVYPSAGNLCPACRKNLQDTTGADLTKTRVEIHRGDQLPPCCYLCGTPTNRIVKWQFKDARGSVPWWKVILGLLLLRFLFFFVMARNTAGYTFRLKLLLPQCKNCACKPEAAAASKITSTRVFTERIVRSFRLRFSSRFGLGLRTRRSGAQKGQGACRQRHPAVAG